MLKFLRCFSFTLNVLQNECQSYKRCTVNIATLICKVIVFQFYFKYEFVLSISYQRLKDVFTIPSCGYHINHSTQINMDLNGVKQTLQLQFNISDIFYYNSGLIKERNPCFSGIPDPVICNKSQRILINDIQYERNCWSCGCKQCCSDGISCEKFRVSDSWENYYIYNAVSGSIENTYITKQKLCPNTGNERKYTNQVHLKFECASGKFLYRLY